MARMGLKSGEWNVSLPPEKKIAIGNPSPTMLYVKEDD
jgi:hypothetical protein